MKPRFFELAKKVSKLSDHKQHQHGAVVVKKNRVLSLAANKTKTHPRSKHLWKSCHAEFLAVLRAGLDNVAGADVYVYRENKAGVPSMSAPCNSCKEFLAEQKINKVFYSQENGWGMWEKK